MTKTLIFDPLGMSSAEVVDGNWELIERVPLMAPLKVTFKGSLTPPIRVPVRGLLGGKFRK